MDLQDDWKILEQAEESSAVKCSVVIRKDSEIRGRGYSERLFIRFRESAL